MRIRCFLSVLVSLFLVTPSLTRATTLEVVQLLGGERIPLSSMASRLQGATR